MPSSVLNSDDGVISGTSGLKSSGGDDGVTNFQQNGTTQASITPAGLFQFNSGYGSVATAYGCRAWVNFNGTGTVAIREDGNVSSITDNGTGDYTVNFTTAMPDADYAATGSGQNISGLYSAITFNSNSNGAAGVTNPTTTAFRFTITASGVGAVDSTYVNVAIFR